MNDINQEIVRALFEYDPETGVLRRKKTGTTGYKRPDDYLVFCVCGKNRKAHRLIWLYVYGALPSDAVEIDHINGDKSDNRLTNLRLSTHGQNICNSATYRTNSLGVKGVYMFKGKYRAHVTEDGKQRHLGTFESLEAAIGARSAAAQTAYGEFNRG